MAPVWAAQVYLDESGDSAAKSVVSAGQERPATAHPTGFHLVFRENGRCPVTMWEPVPREGYVALGTLVEGAPQVPEAAEVLTVRADLARPTRTFDAPAWRWDPPALQVRPCAAACLKLLIAWLHGCIGTPAEVKRGTLSFPVTESTDTCDCPEGV